MSASVASDSRHHHYLNTEPPRLFSPRYSVTMRVIPTRSDPQCHQPPSPSPSPIPPFDPRRSRRGTPHQDGWVAMTPHRVRSARLLGGLVGRPETSEVHPDTISSPQPCSKPCNGRSPERLTGSSSAVAVEPPSIDRPPRARPAGLRTSPATNSEAQGGTDRRANDVRSSPDRGQESHHASSMALSGSASDDGQHRPSIHGPERPKNGGEGRSEESGTPNVSESSRTRSDRCR